MPEGAFGKLITTGGTDISTGKAFKGVLTAPAGSTVINPLTTLQQSFIAKGQTAEQAQNTVAKALGLDATKFDLNTFDPLAVALDKNATPEQRALGAQLQAQAAKVANFLVTASQTLIGAAGAGKLDVDTINNALMNALVNAIESDSDGVISFSDKAMLEAVMNESVTLSGDADLIGVTDKVAGQADNFAALSASSADSIDKAFDAGGDFTAMMVNFAQTQTVAQGDMLDKMFAAAESGDFDSFENDFLGDAFETAANTATVGDINPDSTDDETAAAADLEAAADTETVDAGTGTPVTGAIDTTAPTVTALTQSGKTLTISAEAGSTLTILDGTTDVTSNFTISESSGTFTAVANAGTYAGTETLSLSAKATDAAGNVGTAFGTPVTGAIDTTAPTVTALTQSGKTLTISAEAGSTLTILDGTTDVTSNFTISESSGTFTAVANAGTYAGTETLNLSAKATDAAGNVGTAFGTPVTGAIDTTAPTVTALTQSGKTLTISAEAGSTLTILDGTTDVTSNFTISESSGTFTAVANAGTYAGTETLNLSAKATDAAGNVGTAFGTPVTGAIDTTAPTVTALTQSGKTLTISAEAGSTLTILDGTTDVTSNFTISESSGTFTAVANAGTYAGTETLNLSAKATDAAGNVGTAFGTPVTGAIDTTAPTVAVTPITYSSTNTVGGGTATLVFGEALSSFGTASIADATSGSITTAALGSAVSSLSGDGLSVALTLSGGTFEAGDIITLTGAADIAGNTANLIFTLA
ncbi:hypothetical protein ABXJ76_14295 [Methylobacter sp. G7]|uniref:beta strand repeat-containing protein n=1 Tax=Methylobacter sp. G7 TaxID=3230117 RepID=UPI003D8012E9